MKVKTYIIFQEPLYKLVHANNLFDHFLLSTDKWNAITNNYNKSPPAMQKKGPLPSKETML